MDAEARELHRKQREEVKSRYLQLPTSQTIKARIETVSRRTMLPISQVAVLLVECELIPNQVREVILTRDRIVEALRAKPLTVMGISKMTGIPYATVYSALKRYSRGNAMCGDDRKFAYFKKSNAKLNAKWSLNSERDL